MTFYDVLDEYIGDADSVADIRAVVRNLWYYDFRDYSLRVWQGKGVLYTEDGEEWLGTIDASNTDRHETPPIQDGRDGTSPTYSLGLTIPDLPDQSAQHLYEEIKSDQWQVAGRKVTCYKAIFKIDEALRPTTPYVFFKELIMQSPKFSEMVEMDGNGTLIKKYKVTIPAKDANFGRSNVPNGTYAMAIQQQRALQLGVSVDLGCEYLSLLANRTYQIP